MAMVDVVNWLPTGGLVAQVGWLGSKVGGHLAPCCIHRVNWVTLTMALSWWLHY